MKNKQRKSAEQWQLSNATKAKLFANQKYLYINNNPIKHFHQRKVKSIDILGRVAAIAFNTR